MTTRMLLLGMSALAAAGCGRPYWRDSADRETYPIVEERVASPESAIGRTDLAPAPTSRLADPTDPNFPAKPPDDIVAAHYMASPDGHRGYRHWEKDGVLDRIEPAGWDSSLPRTDAGVLRLDRDKAVAIALENSREYQTRLENVYLAALALTLNRFEFDSRWFLRNDTSLVHLGGPNETNTLRTISTTGFARNFTAGGQLLVDFANSFVWEFTGRSHTASSSVGATLIQPLIRGFGRDVRLESLTQAERDVLYAVREFARFRKQFWADVTVDSGGYLQLLNSVQAVRNAQGNLKSQEATYSLYQKRFSGGRTDAANVDQTYQGLLGARSTLISAEINLQNALDQYKLRLGLPPRFAVELDDAPLDQFRLVEPVVEQLREEIDRFDRARKAELDNVPGVESLKASFAQLEDLTRRTDDLIVRIGKDLAAWRAEVERPGGDAELRDRNRKAYELQKDKPAELRESLAKLKAAITAQRATLTPETTKVTWDGLLKDTNEIAAIVDSAISVESQARIYQIRLPDVDIDEAAAIAYAKEHRLDFLTAQAQVTDAWRKVAVAANALQSDLTVRAEGQLGTEPGSKNPVDFSAAGSRLAVGVQFDGPLNRQAERNVYRASQIAYQRARRNYMAVSDDVELDVRTILRELTRQRLNFEIARQQLLVAVRQLESERRQLTNPVQRDQQRGNDDGATLRILQVQQQLLTARNDIAGNLFGFEQQRVRLLLALEALTLDDRGFPTDDAALLSRLAAPAPANRAP
jgi:outer membrane protein TolC